MVTCTVPVEDLDHWHCTCMHVCDNSLTLRMNPSKFPNGMKIPPEYVVTGDARLANTGYQ